jgi:thiamine biosynthesis lipoprotein
MTISECDTMNLTRRDMIIAAGALAFLAPMPACADVTVQSLHGPAFGTAWRLVLPAGADADAARLAVEETVAAIDAAMSPWRPDSEVSRFNRSTRTGWQDASAETCAVVAEALEVSRLTNGAFNPTVGPLVARYGFGPITGSPGRADAIACRHGALRKTDPDLTLDLCGISKGHALDQIGARLRMQGISDALVELGGEVQALGVHPSGRPWQVAIERPGARPFAVQRIVTPGALALATSGHAPQGYSGPRGQISHLINPVTNRPALSALAAVSVLAPTGRRADALATALTVLGPGRGPELARRLNIPALFLIRRDHGIDEITTAGFDRHILA